MVFKILDYTLLRIPSSFESGQTNSLSLIKFQLQFQLIGDELLFLYVTYYVIIKLL